MTKPLRSMLKSWAWAAGMAGLATYAAATTEAVAQTTDFGGEELIVQTYGGTLAIYFRDNFAAEFNEKYNADVQIEEGLFDRHRRQAARERRLSACRYLHGDRAVGGGSRGGRPGRAAVPGERADA